MFKNGSSGMQPLDNKTIASLKLLGYDEDTIRKMMVAKQKNKASPKAKSKKPRIPYNKKHKRIYHCAFCTADWIEYFLMEETLPCYWVGRQINNCDFVSMYGQLKETKSTYAVVHNCNRCFAEIDHMDLDKTRKLLKEQIKESVMQVVLPQQGE